MKDFITKLLGIRTYEEDFNELQKNHNAIVKEYEDLKRVANMQRAQIAELQDRLEEARNNPDSYWAKELEKYVDQFEADLKAIQEVIKEKDIVLEDVVARNLKLASENETIYNRGYSHGRFNAYHELGVEVLDAKRRGNYLVVKTDEKGEIDEKIEMIGRIEELDEKETEKFLDSIEIDDLTDSNA